MSTLGGGGGVRWHGEVALANLFFVAIAGVFGVATDSFGDDSIGPLDGLKL